MWLSTKKCVTPAAAMKFLDPDAEARVVVEHARHPAVPLRAIRTLGQPHAPRPDAKVLFGRLHADCHLRAHHLIVERERHVVVRRVAGQDLDLVLAEAGGEFADDVAVDPLEVREAIAVPILPSLGEVNQVRLAVAREFVRVPRGAGDALVEVNDEAGLERRVGELFEQHGRQADRQRAAALVERDRADHVEERQVRLGRRLVEPDLAVRLDAVIQDVRQVAVQHGSTGFRGTRSWTVSVRGTAGGQPPRRRAGATSSAR